MVGALVLWGLWASLGGLEGLGFAVWLLLAFVISWFYFGLFETFWNGQTPGKRLFGLRVLRTDGRPINAMQAILRNVLRAVDAMPIWGPARNRRAVLHGRFARRVAQRPLSTARRFDVRDDRGGRATQQSPRPGADAA